MNASPDALPAATVSHGRRIARRGLGALVTGLLAGLLVIFLADPAAAKLVWKEVRPTKQAGQACVRVGKQDARYARLDHKKAAEFSAYGPAKLKVLTRHLPIKGKAGKRSYTLIVERDGQTVFKRKISGSSSKATLCNGSRGPVGASRTSYVTIPKGKHAFRVRVAESGKQVAARFFRQAQADPGTKRIGFAPLEFDRQCKLDTGAGKAYTWFRATPERPVRLTVQGPTELQIRTRVDFELGAPGTLQYNLEVLRNGERESIHGYKAKPDAKARYRDCPGVTPGESKLLRLRVPAGSWTYTLRPAGSGAAAFTTRILIPKNSVGMNGRS